MEGCPDQYRLDNSILTAIWHRDDVFGPIVRPCTGPGFVVVYDNARPHAGTVCRQYLEDEGINTIDWFPRSLDLNLTEDLWDIMFPSSHQRRPRPGSGGHAPPLSGTHASTWGLTKLASSILSYCNHS